jgi:hypothetical protein
MEEYKLPHEDGTKYLGFDDAVELYVACYSPDGYTNCPMFVSFDKNIVNAWIKEYTKDSKYPCQYNIDVIVFFSIGQLQRLLTELQSIITKLSADSSPE